MLNFVTWKPFICAGLLASIIPSSCHHHEEEHKEEETILKVTRPIKKDTRVVHDYVCQIHSNRNIEVRALERGYLEQIHVKEGQLLKEGEPMFKILPLVYQAELRRAEAKARVAEVKYLNTKRLTEKGVVSAQELAIAQAELQEAQADVNLAQTHLGFTELKAPFAGLMDRLLLRQGSLVEEGDLLTTLSDNSVMWVYFNVPEAEYLDFVSETQSLDRNDKDKGKDKDKDDDDDDDDDDGDDPQTWSEDRKVVELVMANGQKFKHPGKINTIEAEFNNETGTIMFRADFPNPERLLRHGETGNIQMKKMVKGALLIPQKCTYEILDHHYVFVVGKDDVVYQQRVHISEQLEDLFIISEGLTENDKIVLEGLRHARNGEKARYEFEEPEEVYKNLKLRAE